MEPNPYEAPGHATDGAAHRRGAISGRGIVMGCLLVLAGLATAFAALVFYLAYVAQVTA